MNLFGCSIRTGNEKECRQYTELCRIFSNVAN